MRRSAIIVTASMLFGESPGCSASTTRVVVGADKISFPHDPVQVAMMVDITGRCARGRDGFAFACGGSVMTDGTVPTGCNPTPTTTA